jgi:hypothetical protein
VNSECLYSRIPAATSEQDSIRCTKIERARFPLYYTIRRYTAFSNSAPSCYPVLWNYIVRFKLSACPTKRAPYTRIIYSYVNSAIGQNASISPALRLAVLVAWPGGEFFFLISISIAEFWTPLIGCFIRNQLFINTLMVGVHVCLQCVTWSEDSSWRIGRVSHLFLQIGRSFSIKFFLSSVYLCCLWGKKVHGFDCWHYWLYMQYIAILGLALLLAHNSSTNIVRRLNA